jgi:hypothetical protein
MFEIKVMDFNKIYSLCYVPVFHDEAWENSVFEFYVTLWSMKYTVNLCWPPVVPLKPDQFKQVAILQKILLIFPVFSIVCSLYTLNFCIDRILRVSTLFVLFLTL